MGSKRWKKRRASSGCRSTSRVNLPWMVIVVVGVSGSGKWTGGAALAQRLRVPFADADDFHPPANIAKMEAGTPLNDDDRYPWLEAIGGGVGDPLGAGGGGRRLSVEL